MFSADIITDAVRSQISIGLCSTQPALRQDLLMLELMAAHLGAVVVEDHAAGAGGALVDRCDELGQLLLPSYGIPIVHHGLLGRTDQSTLTACPVAGRTRPVVDRLLQTDGSEYLDRDDVDDAAHEARKRSVIRALEWTGEFFGNTEKFARIALDEVADIADPKILELGAGHGGLSRKLLEWHPTAELTVTDIEAASVAAMAAGDLGEHPRAIVREMDAIAIDAPDGHFDLAVFALSFHHLPPRWHRGCSRGHPRRRQAADHRSAAAAVTAARPAARDHAAVRPGGPFVHDGLISSLRTYSPSALRALAAARRSGDRRSTLRSAARRDQRPPPSTAAMRRLTCDPWSATRSIPVKHRNDRAEIVASILRHASISAVRNSRSRHRSSNLRRHKQFI